MVGTGGLLSCEFQTAVAAAVVMVVIVVKGFSLFCHREAKVAIMDGWLFPHHAAPTGGCSNDLVLSKILVS